MWLQEPYGRMFILLLLLHITSGPANILYYMCEQQVFTVAEAGADTRFIQYQILCWF